MPPFMLVIADIDIQKQVDFVLRFVSVMKEEAKDPLELQLALRVCREDLTKAQEELSKMKAEYWDVVPRRNWDNLEQTHKQTLLQVVHKDRYGVHTVHSCIHRIRKLYVNVKSSP